MECEYAYLKYVFFFFVGLVAPYFVAKGIFTIQEKRYRIRVPHHDKPRFKSLWYGVSLIYIAIALSGFYVYIFLNWS